MSGGRTTWMGIDVAWMRRDLNVRLAMRCGGEAFAVLLTLWLDAKQQRSADGRVKFGYAAVARESFVDLEKVEEVVAEAVKIGAITGLEADDHGRLKGTLTDFAADDRRGGEALKKAGQRANRHDGTEGDTGGQEQSLSPPVPLEERRGEEKTADAVSSPAVPAYDADVLRLCQLQSDLARSRTDEPATSRRLRPTKTWHAEMDRLIRLDGRTPSQVENAIRWVDQHRFWRKVVLSVPTLRDKFPQLIADAKAEAAPRPPPADDRNAARRQRTAERLSSLMQPTTETDVIEGSVAHAA